MTLIGSFELNGIHALFGDLLLSSGQRPSRGIDLPTRGPTLEAIAKGSYYRGLCQKVCVLNDRLIIAWSGPLLTARQALSLLEKEFRSQEITIERINAVLKKIGTEKLRNLYLIGLCISGNQFMQFGWNSTILRQTNPMVEQGLGQCLASGSGIQRYHEKLGKIKAPNTDAAYYGLMLGSGFTGDELSGAPNLEAKFGGGFELGFIQPNGARKVGDILHMFWLWEKGVHEFPVSLPMFMKSDYVGTDLVLQRLHIEQINGSTDFRILDHTKFAVRRPIDPDIMDFADLGIKTPDLNCHYLCNYYLCKNRDRTEIITTVRGLRSRKGHISISPKGDLLDIKLAEEFKKAELTLMQHGLEKLSFWND